MSSSPILVSIDSWLRKWSHKNHKNEFNKYHTSYYNIKNIKLYVIITKISPSRCLPIPITGAYPTKSHPKRTNDLKRPHVTRLKIIRSS